MSPLYITLICLSAAAAAGILALFLWLSNNRLTVSRYNMDFKGKDGKIKIVQLSDLHGKSFGKGNARLIKKVRALRPDVIAVTGDIIHKYTGKNIKTALELVSELAKTATVLYVSGNHEMRGTGYRNLRAQIEEAGGVVLDNNSIQVSNFTFTGLNGAHNKNGTARAIFPQDKYTVLLAHMPQHIKNYAAAGYRLVLSGHAHGGQWRIPFTNRGVYAPGQGLFPKYTCGLYKEGDCQMIVSRGLGNSQFPLRLFNPPELVEIIIN